MKAYNCDFDNLAVRPLQPHLLPPASGPMYGCVDWFQYDPGVLVGADRATNEADAPSRDTIATLHEQRQLMGYVR